MWTNTLGVCDWVAARKSNFFIFTINNMRNEKYVCRSKMPRQWTDVLYFLFLSFSISKMHSICCYKTTHWNTRNIMFLARERYIFTFRFNCFVIETSSDTVRWRAWQNRCTHAHSLHTHTHKHTNLQPKRNVSSVAFAFFFLLMCASLAICFIFHRNRHQRLNSSGRDTAAGTNSFHKCNNNEMDKNAGTVCLWRCTGVCNLRTLMSPIRRRMRTNSKIFCSYQR